VEGGKKGIYTYKEAFKLLNNSLRVQLPQNGYRSITPQAMYILNQNMETQATCSMHQNFMLEID